MMYSFSTLRVACVAVLAARCSAIVSLKGAKPAADQGVAQALIRDRVIAALGGFEMQLHSPAKAPTQDMKAPGQGASAANQPVAVQVDEKTVKELEGELSPECGKRFNALMTGKGPQTSQFNKHGEGEDANKQCNELKGKICATKATVMEEYTHSDGRNLEQSIEVTGNGCLPEECMSQRDVQTLATFMHGQTEQVMSSISTDVGLEVDCTKSGGGVAMLGGEAKKAQEAQVKESKSTKAKSGTVTLCAGGMALLAAGIASMM